MRATTPEPPGRPLLCKPICMSSHVHCASLEVSLSLLWRWRLWWSYVLCGLPLVSQVNYECIFHYQECYISNDKLCGCPEHDHDLAPASDQTQIPHTKNLLVQFHLFSIYPQPPLHRFWVCSSFAVNSSLLKSISLLISITLSIIFSAKVPWSPLLHQILLLKAPDSQHHEIKRCVSVFHSHSVQPATQGLINSHPIELTE